MNVFRQQGEPIYYMTGYPITQQWLGGPQQISVNTPSGCTTGAAGCVTTQQEVIGYTDGGIDSVTLQNTLKYTDL